MGKKSPERDIEPKKSEGCCTWSWRLVRGDNRCGYSHWCNHDSDFGTLLKPRRDPSQVWCGMDLRTEDAVEERCNESTSTALSLWGTHFEQACLTETSQAFKTHRDTSVSTKTRAERGRREVYTSGTSRGPYTCKHFGANKHCFMLFPSLLGYISWINNLTTPTSHRIKTQISLKLTHRGSLEDQVNWGGEC